MFETVEKLTEALNYLEEVKVSGSVNMLNQIRAIANINEVIKELRGDNDAQS